MRFLRLFIAFLLAVLLVGGGGYLAVREGILWWAARQVSGEVQFLMRTNQWQNLVSKCYEGNNVAVAKQLQLRFTDGVQYVLEVGCDNYRTVEMKRGQLPLSVVKTTGTAGFIYDLQSRTVTGALTLHFLDQDRVVEARTDEVVTYKGATTVVSDSLITSCRAHGFQCCDVALEQGQGTLFRTGVNDCQDSCYAACVRRPNLILFETDPLLADPVARRVEVSKSVPTVFFQYAFGEGDGTLQQVVINYGDGTRDSSTEKQGEFVKQYTCDEETCTYHAQIQAIDGAGIQSSLTRIAEIDVVLIDR